MPAKKTIGLSVTLLIVTLIIPFFMPGHELLAASKPINLSITHMEPTTHFKHGIIEKWAKRIEEQTGGKIHFTIYPAGTLCAPPELIDSVIGGVADIGAGTPGYTPARFPLNAFCTDHMHKVPSSVIGSEMYKELWENNEELQKEFRDTRVLWLAVHSPGNLHTKFPAHTLDDIAGKDIRFPGSLSPLATALGMVPVSMPMSDTFISLQKGIVDGCVAPIAELKNHRLGEVTEYTLELNFYVGAMYTVMNLKTWNSIPTDVQEVIDNTSTWASLEEAKGWDRSDEEARVFSEKYNHKFVQPSSEVLEEAYKRLAVEDKNAATKLDNQGLPGSEILHEIKLLEDKYISK